MGRAIRVEKLKWDGTLSAADVAHLVTASSANVAWVVANGTRRVQPKKGDTDVVGDELWAAVPGEWWVLCASSRAGGTVDELVLHAAAPFDPSAEAELIRWIDLDLDFEVRGGHIGVEDEEQFHEHAQTMHYPPEVIRGAWDGISRLAARYTTGEWPFDGWLERMLATGRAELAQG